MIPPQQQPDAAGAVLAIDQAMIALAVAKSVLLGETSAPAPLASLRDREHYTPEGREPFPHFPHLAEHVGGNPVCIICGIDHDAAARLAPPAQLTSASIPPQENS